MTAYQGWSMCFRLLAVALVLMNVPHVAGAQPATGKVPSMGILVIESQVGRRANTISFLPSPVN